jgi:transcriptional regulator with XRE-family HTH domain
MDHRAVPLEVLRDFVRSQTELSSIRQVAAEVGLGRTTLHSFVNGETNPHPRVRRVLALWYLQELEQAPDIDVARPYVSALEILLADVPEEKRREAQQSLLEFLEQTHEGGEATPRWLELLRTQPRLLKRLP